MNRLQNVLHEQAGKFVDAMLEALRGATLEELLAESLNEAKARKAPRAPRSVSSATPKAKPAKTKKTAGGRLARRSPAEVAEVVASVAALLKKHPKGLRSEEIRKELGLDVREIPRVLKQGVETKALRVLSGQKRSTTYGAGGSRASAPAKPARKAKAKRAAPKKAKAKVKPPKKAAPPKKAKPTKKASPKKAAPKAKAAPKSAPKKALNGVAAPAAAAAG